MISYYLMFESENQEHTFNVFTHNLSFQGSKYHLLDDKE
jgi:hypothetical protein